MAGSNGWCFQYKKTTTAQSWERSRELCQAEGGDLAHDGFRDVIVKRYALRNKEATEGCSKLHCIFTTGSRHG